MCIYIVYVYGIYIPVWDKIVPLGQNRTPGPKSYPFYENIKLINNPEFSMATHSIDPIQIHNISNKIGLLA